MIVHKHLLILNRGFYLESPMGQYTLRDVVLRQSQQNISLPLTCLNFRIYFLYEVCPQKIKEQRTFRSREAKKLEKLFIQINIPN